MADGMVTSVNIHWKHGKKRKCMCSRHAEVPLTRYFRDAEHLALDSWEQSRPGSQASFRRRWTGVHDPGPKGIRSPGAGIRPSSSAVIGDQ